MNDAFVRLQLIAIAVHGVTNVTFEHLLRCDLLQWWRRWRWRRGFLLRNWQQTFVLLHLLHSDIVRPEHVHFEAFVVAEFRWANLAFDEHAILHLVHGQHMPFVSIFRMNSLLTNATTQPIVHIVLLQRIRVGRVQRQIRRTEL